MRAPYPGGNVLVFAPQGDLLRSVLEVLAGAGLRGVVARDLAAAGHAFSAVAGRVGAGPFDLALVDVDLAGCEALLEEVRRNWPEMPVVALGREDRAQPALRASRLGCRDYLVTGLGSPSGTGEPVDKVRLAGLIRQLLPSHEVELAVAGEAAGGVALRIAGRSPQFLESLNLARRVAATTVPVLITGESGTGKELVSYLIHRHSSRRDGPYIRVNCAALSESLLESELFGHERGAFTGAYQQRKGRFERAHGGTLLLDEISETTPRLQAELLRVLEQQDFERVGGSESVRVNVRILCTSNRDLAQDVEVGRFRRDLYYRISGFHLAVPALRDRPDDIPVLVWHFVNQHAREVRRTITDLDPAMLEALARCPWPGNVRQLRNVVRSALILGSGPVLSLENVAGSVGALAAEAGGPDGRASGEPCGGLSNKCSVAVGACSSDAVQGVPGGQPPHGGATNAVGLRLADLERQAILEAMRRTQSHQVKAARLLGITDRTLREKLRRYRQADNAGQAEPALASSPGGARALPPARRPTGDATWQTQLR